jgi:hypothetical protein
VVVEQMQTFSELLDGNVECVGVRVFVPLELVKLVITWTDVSEDSPEPPPAPPA